MSNHYNITINLWDDINKKCLDWLANENLIHGKDEPIVEWLNYCHRKIKNKMRKIKRSKELLIPKEYIDIINKLEEKIINGEDLNQYLSRKMSNADYNDALLNDWRIYHFHLVENPQTERCKDLLFAYIDDDYVYMIQIYDHKFTHKEMIDIIEENWPELIKNYTVPCFDLEYDCTDNDIEKLRNSGINPLIKSKSGKFYFGFGGGYTVNNKSNFVMFERNRIYKLIDKIEKNIKKQMQDIIEKQIKDYGKYNQDFDFYLYQVDDNFNIIVKEKNNNISFIFNSTEK